VTAQAALRRRLSRGLSRGRWRDYRDLLAAALERGYEIVSVEDWVGRPPGDGGQTLALRHDVDQNPRSALAMSAVEQELGVSSSWYFRWRTAHPKVIEELRRRGSSVGLHYETLSRRARETGAGPADCAALIEECCGLLRSEITAFAALHGPIRSVTPHGDSRVPWADNAALLRRQDWNRYGVEFDANDAMRGRGVRYWLTDRPAPAGPWRYDVEPRGILDRGVTPILCLTHPNNWASGPSLWVDRVLRRVLPGTRRGDGRPLMQWPIRTAGDRPPW
jgi:hypothetical protein